jgi:hypothetical protein
MHVFANSYFLINNKVWLKINIPFSSSSLYISRIFYPWYDIVHGMITMVICKDFRKRKCHANYHLKIFKNFYIINLLRYNWGTVNWTYLKCVIWFILANIKEIIKIINISITYKCFLRTFLISYWSFVYLVLEKYLFNFFCLF